MGVPDPLAAAVAENALWCDRVGRAVGARTVVDRTRWWSPTRMPPLHPDAVSLVPGLGPDDLLAGLDLGPGCSVKDSHAEVDLAGAGFEVVVAGRWWHRLPGPAPSPTRLTTVVALGDEVADGVLAGDPEVRLVVVADADGRPCARAVLHEAGEVVGLSNVVTDPGSEADAWRAVVGVAAGRHLVGWEPEDAVAPVADVGGEVLGPLRVWAWSG